MTLPRALQPVCEPGVEREGAGGRRGRLRGDMAVKFEVAQPSPGAPAVSIVIPSYNERANIRPLVVAVARAMGEVPWEMIVVDDDSPDGTFNEVLAVAQDEPRVRCLRRVGRRGLSSAVIEGALVANGEVIAVMDADFQHDETALARMYDKMRDPSVDLVVASRYAAGGSLGDWNGPRRVMSDLATRMSRLLIGDATTDPMSGFFMVRRTVLASCIYDLSQQGYKVLLDIITSAPRRLKIAEAPYAFRDRRDGESKIDAMVLAEYGFLLIDKLSHGWLPPRFFFFGAVGGLGVGVHLATLYAMKSAALPFLKAQVVASFTAMLFNYTLNNAITYRDRRLTGLRFLVGLAVFVVVCSIGALANVGVASLAIAQTHSWSLSGLAGALMGSAFNFGMTNKLVWGRPRRSPAAASEV